MKTIMKMGIQVLAVLAVAFLFSGAAQADSVTLSGCSSCFGSTYTLTVTQTGPNTYTVKLEIDTTGYTGDGTHISSVNFKVSGDIDSITLTSAPGGTAGWTTSNSPISNEGCSSTVDAGFGCSSDPAPVNLAPVGGILTWTWEITTSNLQDDWHIGAKYNNDTGTLNGNITSEEVIIPEPATMLLFGAGLAAIGGAARRRFRSRS